MRFWDNFHTDTGAYLLTHAVLWVSLHDQTIVCSITEILPVAVWQIAKQAVHELLLITEAWVE